MSVKLKVLIVEDDLMIADMAEEVIEHGYEVCGIARTVGEAIALGELHKPELALVDHRLADNGLGTEVAVKLKALGKIGILFASGNDPQVGMLESGGDACIVKPYRARDLIKALEIVKGIIATGVATPPFPRGFQVLTRITPKEPAVSHE